MTTKMTYVDALDIAISSLTNEIAKARLVDLKASIIKKNSAERGETAKQLDNKNFKATILNGMEPGYKYTATQIWKAFLGDIADMSNQRVSALLNQLSKDNKLVREVVKGKTYFSLPVEENA